MLADLRHAVRLFRQQTWITLVIVAVLALGTGANTAIFGLVNAVLLQPLPFHDADRLVMIWGFRAAEADGIRPVSVPTFREWQNRSTVFERLAASSDATYSLTGAGDPVSVNGYRFDAEFFGVLGTGPLLGRTFFPEEVAPGATRVVVLSHRLWQRRFAGDAGVLGRAITLNGEPSIVIGVMPAGFHHPERAELWTPLVIPARFDSNWNARPLRVAARLRPGVTLEQAQAEMSRLADDMARAQPANAGETVRLSSFRDERTADIRPALLLLTGAAGFILLIACANVANLLLARASGRATEMAVRSALGASRGRLARQLLAESTVLAMAGSVAGLGLAIWLSNLLVAMFPNNIANLSIPRIEAAPIDWRVLAFALLLSGVTTLAFGIAPAAQAGRAALNQRVAAPPSRRVRHALVVAEAALTLVLLTGAGLMLRSFLHVVQSDLGIEPRHALALQVILSGTRYGNAEQQASFVDAVVARLQRVPGVEAAGATNYLPLSGFWGSTSVRADGMPSPPPGQEIEADYRVATPDYFRAMGIRLVQGRAFSEGDRADRPAVTILNQSLARRFWPDGDVVGERVAIGSTEKPDLLEVVGVIADVKSFGQEEPTHFDVYRPFAQEPSGLVAFTVRTAMPASSMFPVLRQQIWAEDPELPTFREDTMQQLADESTALRRVSLQVLAGFALVALALAAFGTYGVMSYVVSQRLPEIGVRMALGAEPGRILSLVLGEVGRTAAAGLVLGLLAALAVTRLASSLLVGVTPGDPVVYAASGLLLLLVVVFAGYLPARRASAVDPLTTLRRE
jgi:putative ABC transport system permease protein